MRLTAYAIKFRELWRSRETDCALNFSRIPNGTDLVINHGSPTRDSRHCRYR